MALRRSSFVGLLSSCVYIRRFNLATDFNLSTAQFKNAQGQVDRPCCLASHICCGASSQASISGTSLVIGPVNQMHACMHTRILCNFIIIIFNAPFCAHVQTSDLEAEIQESADQEMQTEKSEKEVDDVVSGEEPLVGR